MDATVDGQLCEVREGSIAHRHCLEREVIGEEEGGRFLNRALEAVVSDEELGEERSIAQQEGSTGIERVISQLHRSETRHPTSREGGVRERTAAHPHMLKRTQSIQTQTRCRGQGVGDISTTTTFSTPISSS